jgi:hypothetical protein
MTLKAKMLVAMAIITGAVLLLPTSVADWLYYQGVIRSDVLYFLAKWILPPIVLVVSFILLKNWVKALIAGAISWFASLMLLGAGLLFSLDCGGDATASDGLHQVCTDGSTVVYAFKIGIAAMLCFNMFLLYRLAFMKAPKVVQKTK